jgi:hypothetical protein
MAGLVILVIKKMEEILVLALSVFAELYDLSNINNDKQTFLPEENAMWTPGLTGLVLNACWIKAKVS